MNTKTILGISLAAVFAISMTMTAAMADEHPGYLVIEDAAQNDNVLSMTLEDNVKEVSAKKALDLVTFWAWAIPGDADLTVAAITLHHNVNDHQAFDAIVCPDDNKKTCKPIQSSPVQSFHPHIAEFTNIGTEAEPVYCVSGLESPKLDFRVHNQKTITLELDDDTEWAEIAATGTIGDMGLDENDDPLCPIANLGITSANLSDFS